MALFNSYYVNNSAFLALSRRDAEKATSLIVDHFRRFGLKIHFCIRSAGKASKKEAMFIPRSHLCYNKYSNIPSDLVAGINLDTKFP